MKKAILLLILLISQYQMILGQNNQVFGRYSWRQVDNLDASTIKKTYKEDSIIYSNSIKKINQINDSINRLKQKDPLNKSKDPFETSEAYKNRIEKINEKYEELSLSKTQPFTEIIANFKDSSYLVPASIQLEIKVENYNADHSTWKIGLKEKFIKHDVSIFISPDEARKLWSNKDSVSIYNIKNFKKDASGELLIVYENLSNSIHLMPFYDEVITEFNSQILDQEENKVFTRVEVDASFPGGIGAWTRFLTNNLDSYLPSLKGAQPGSYTVVVRFIVSKDGSVSDVTAETNYGYGMEQEAIRVIKKSGRWTPAIQNGRNVTAYKRQSMNWIVTE